MKLVVITHNIRSTHNIGSIFRTADGFAVEKLYATGYTPYPEHENDSRPPHIRKKINQAIHKTALGAEQSVPFAYKPEPAEVIKRYGAKGYTIAALEQSPQSIALPNYNAPEKLVLILGEEVAGVPSNMLALCQDILEIPMHGTKESFNVSVATGIALYALTS